MPDYSPQQDSSPSWAAKGNRIPVASSTPLHKAASASSLPSTSSSSAQKLMADCTNSLLSESEEDSLLNSSNRNECFVEDLKFDFYEKGQNNDVVIVRLGQKGIIADRSMAKVKFGEKTVRVEFKTRNQTFLREHNRLDPETVFVWSTELFELIDPNFCDYRVESLLELKLKKASPAKKWTRLSAKPAPSFPRKMTRTPSSPSTATLYENEDEKESDSVHSSSIRAPSPSVENSELETNSSTDASFPSTSAGFEGVGSSKPTCYVTPYKEEKGVVVAPGFTGLRNIGNTCFINSTLQVLVNTKELKEYFLRNYHFLDLNTVNPLGMKGELAVSFGKFMSEMWDCLERVVEPSKIKALVAKKATQFANFAQHDAQEFLSFLLDGLHEDLNRVVEKPVTETIEGDGKPDEDVADEAWRLYLLRNDSVIVDLFHGQLKSRLECPKCARVSITFDPFVYLPVPFPKNKRSYSFYFWKLDVSLPPVKYSINVAEDASIRCLFKKMGKKVNVEPELLVMIEDFQHKIWQVWTMDTKETVRMLSEMDVLYLFEVETREKLGEEVYNFAVIQRLVCKARTMPVVCSSCHGEGKHLKACVRCYRAFYCGSTCQKEDWKNHQKVCQFPKTADLVGHPFIISVPKSKATYSYITQLMERRSRYTVDIFMPPVCQNRGSSVGDEAGCSRSTDVDISFTEEPMDLEEDNQSEGSTLSSNQSEASDVTVTGFPSETNQKEETVLEQNLPTEDKANDSGCVDNPSGEDVEKGVANPVSVDLHQKHGTLKLFHLRYCTGKDGNTDHAAGNLNGRVIEDNGDEVLDLLDLCKEKFLAMDWINKKFSEDFVMVETKETVDHVLSEDYGRTGTEVRELELTDLLHLFAEKEILSDQECCNLELKPYLCPGAPEQETRYDLYGVVCHSGSSYFGHYISHARLTDYDSTKTEIGWRLFNDSFVSQSQGSHAIDEDAYLLFYKRRGVETKDVVEAYTEKCEEISELKLEYEKFRAELDQSSDVYNRCGFSILSNTNTASSWSTDYDSWDPSTLDQDENESGFSVLPKIEAEEE